MRDTIRAYQIGLAAIGIFGLVLFVLVIVEAGATRQDAATDKAAQTAVTKLNDYIDKNQIIPNALAATGVGELPKTISYSKLSDSQYKFCVTYKSASSGFDASTAVTDVATGSLGSSYSSLAASSTANSSDSTYLYLPSTHKKGANCQTIKPYLYNSYDNSYNYSDTSTNSGTSSSLLDSVVGIQSKARDTERQTDLRQLQGQLEAYYASNAYYPTLADLNDETWRSQNLRGLDKEAVRDPQGSGYSLAASPAAKSYSYSALDQDGKACDNVSHYCYAYTLTATLEAGNQLVLKSLN